MLDEAKGTSEQSAKSMVKCRDRAKSRSRSNHYVTGGGIWICDKLLWAFSVASGFFSAIRRVLASMNQFCLEM
nr:hypothetical protein CFP56_69867 [Quercus suber]